MTLKEARQRGDLFKRQWLELLGGAYSAGQLAALRGNGEDDDEVERLRHTGMLFAVRLPGGTWGYPRALYDARGRLVDGVLELLGAMQVSAPWAQVQELVVPDAGAPDSVLTCLLREGTAALPSLMRRVSLAGGG